MEEIKSGYPSTLEPCRKLQMPWFGLNKKYFWIILFYFNFCFLSENLSGVILWKKFITFFMPPLSRRYLPTIKLNLQSLISMLISYIGCALFLAYNFQRRKIFWPQINSEINKPSISRRTSSTSMFLVIRSILTESRENRRNTIAVWYKLSLNTKWSFNERITLIKLNSLWWSNNAAVLPLYCESDSQYYNI